MKLLLVVLTSSYLLFALCVWFLMWCAAKANKYGYRFTTKEKKR